MENDSNNMKFYHHVNDNPEYQKSMNIHLFILKQKTCFAL